MYGRLRRVLVFHTLPGSVFQMKEATQGEAKHRITTATGLVAQTLYDNFAYPTEKKDYYYFTMQLDEVAGMIDTIGGVEINNPAAITTEREVTFPAGVQTLDGKLSAEYLRAYKPGGDPARLKRQNLYMKALQTKILSAEILAKSPRAVQAVRQGHRHRPEPQAARSRWPACPKKCRRSRSSSTRSASRTAWSAPPRMGP